MTKKDFIDKIAEKTGYTKKDINEVLSATRDVVWGVLKEKDEIRIFDSITLKTQHVAERNGRNPQTGDALVIPARYAPRAKFGKKLKDFINE